MSEPEEQKQPQESTQQHPDLGSELRELGNQIEQAIRSALNSETSKTIQRDFSRGLGEVGKQMQTALKAIQDNVNLQDLAGKGQQAIEQVQESNLVKELQEALTQGVSKLNEQLGVFIARTQAAPPPASGEPTAQDIPIDEGNTGGAATGETVRLDPDKKE